MKSFVLILSPIVLYGIMTTQTAFAEPTITVSTDKPSSILCGSSIKMVLNSEGKVDEAAKGIVSAMGYNNGT